MINRCSRKKHCFFYMAKTLITGTGAYMPEVVQMNESFVNGTFYEENGVPVQNSSHLVVEKFRKITGIRERRYVPQHLTASDIAAQAGNEALISSGIDPETLDQVIVAHNFGDVAHNSRQSQNVPSLASKVKHILGIQNPSCICYDVLVGCPGWVHGLIQSHAYFKAGMAKKILLVGSETLSRVIDPFDRDSMIFADGAGACVLEYRNTGVDGAGILGCAAQTHSVSEVNYINMGRSYATSEHKSDNELYIKMKGRKVYEYALKNVPVAMKQCLDDSGVDITQVSKIFLHQANEKMDEEILKRLFALYGLPEPPEGIMPMTIQWLGNSSVATVPTLYHMVRSGLLSGHEINGGDIVLFASVGAGMNINAVCYRV
jgi:3-oxoacyl-[acyl-carrier-protein] synthase-3